MQAQAQPLQLDRQADDLLAAVARLPEAPALAHGDGPSAGASLRVVSFEIVGALKMGDYSIEIRVRDEVSEGNVVASATLPDGERLWSRGDDNASAWVGLLDQIQAWQEMQSVRW